jgi:histidine triad (HIT) family protein
MSPSLSSDCIFCKIASGVIPVTRVYETDELVCFPDVNPQAPTHLLLIPKKHISSLAHTTSAYDALLGHLLAAAREVASQKDLAAGYRVVVNTGPDGGQSVDHLHLHILAGRHMTWPPG